ncbi:MAG: MogA/MoaB family molybdenum cofactor biosynthesis protein [Candidatus Heimdallarchaeum endolithica]|uniref:MogA/MoaB family molybdenum cofactor biosynthesis protein n=1 Tax=Candidatus Heimdallarchaeum endolithica TaxID=2876572 RepID=A0A9Y1FMZ8_9ARCH|nr:MAG: MogA/MoaB family molybdenum cofactor biosynthesis protein [Candidatus Heimdallarchaeum endolithica]
MVNETPKDKHTVNKNIPINVQLIMVSDSLSKADDITRKRNDKSGNIAKDMLEKEGISPGIIIYVEDNLVEIQKIVKLAVEEGKNFIITMGGTGISSRDVTIEAVKPLLTKQLDGFGELFRSLTFEQVGTVSIMTRALAGIIKQSLVVSLPGSPNAVKLGIDIILKELMHILNLIRK